MLKRPAIPPQVMLPDEIEEANIIKQWLNTRRNSQKVELLVPRRGRSADLVKMAAENASETLEPCATRWEADTNKQAQALQELQQSLQLSKPLNKIECYDISNTQGTSSVGSMVIFTQGVPDKKNYRHFNIKTVIGPDDFASMEEVLSTAGSNAGARITKKRTRVAKPIRLLRFCLTCSLSMAEKDNLGRAVKILDAYGLTELVPVVGLAKREEELFLPSNPIPILLPRHSQAHVPGTAHPG